MAGFVVQSMWAADRFEFDTAHEALAPQYTRTNASWEGLDVIVLVSPCKKTNKYFQTTFNNKQGYTSSKIMVCNYGQEHHHCMSFQSKSEANQQK